MTHTARITAVVALSLALATIWSAGRAAAQTPLLEVEKSDATKLLQVSDDAGFVVKGATGAGAIPASGAGARLMWYPKKAAFRAGWVSGAQWDEASIGPSSVALGTSTTASGDRSVAMGGASTASGTLSTALGNATTASGHSSTAMGINTLASGAYSTTMGDGTEASGGAATAMGAGTRASGQRSTAMGTSTVASGNTSTAMGTATLASGQNSTAIGFSTSALGAGSVAMGSYATAQGVGSFVFGDASTSEIARALDNQFLVRAYGGVGFNSASGIGCDLNPGEGAWACTSSRLAKEGFEDVNGEMVLAKLAGIPIQRWRYIGAEAAHVGPTAEDFRAAFGLGEGSTKIATVDADGIALRAVQALERRTAELREENTALRAENAAMRAELTSLGDRVRELAGEPPAAATPNPGDR